MRSLSLAAALLVVAGALLFDGCDGGDGCLRAPGCPTSTHCCDGQSVCQATVCQGIRYICRNEGGSFAWRENDVCSDDGAVPDSIIPSDADGRVADASVDGPRDGEAPDAVDAAADGSDGPPGDGPPGDGPSPDQGGCKWGATGNGNDPCNGVPAETWRCVFTTEFGGTTVSQVCRNNKWVNYNLTPRNCKACCGSYTIACDQ